MLTLIWHPLFTHLGSSRYRILRFSQGELGEISISKDNFLEHCYASTLSDFGTGILASW